MDKYVNNSIFQINILPKKLFMNSGKNFDL